MSISRPASNLLDELVTAAERVGWKQTARTRVAISRVWEAYHRIPVANADNEYDRAVLRRLLLDLEASGQIRLLRSDDREKVALPTAIWLLPTRSATTPPATMPPWHPELRGLATLWPAATPKQRAAYAAVNRWLLTNPDRSRVPVRERSLEIFGRHGSAANFPTPEKVLDTLRSGPFFSDREELLRLIGAFVVHPPLLAERFTEAIGDGYYHRVGGGRMLLVIENATTWWSVVNSLPEQHDLGYVAWGLGNTFTASVKTLSARHAVAEIRYFGDLDLSGLRIPLSASATAVGNGLPQVRPAIHLYRDLLRLGLPIAAKENAAASADATRLAGWLGENTSPVAALLTRGERLAQEWVGFRHLRANTAWHADVRSSTHPS
ncbi:MAG TPA: Wadjet anti-phage system protein JetD domain-containing protein [Actinoplanes sp.]|nr:Wadjet anti-phage system protein JetD domain-containing protein [Actinoplanes sp.]